MNDMQRLLEEVEQLREVNRKLTCELAETKKENSELTTQVKELVGENITLKNELMDFRLAMYRTYTSMDN